MKSFIFLPLLLCSLFSIAQSKKTRQVLANTWDLERAVFETKDSAALEKLFAKDLIYVHSNGKQESRSEAILGIIHNKSKYTISSAITSCGVKENGDSLITDKRLIAVETKENGSLSNLDLTIEMVWIKENKEWKLVRRTATKNQLMQAN